MCTTDLIVSKAVNFEIKERYTLVLTATDGDGLQGMTPITVVVADVGEPPSVSLCQV